MVRHVVIRFAVVKSVQDEIFIEIKVSKSRIKSHSYMMCVFWESIKFQALITDKQSMTLRVPIWLTNIVIECLVSWKLGWQRKGRAMNPFSSSRSALSSRVGRSIIGHNVVWFVSASFSKAMSTSLNWGSHRTKHRSPLPQVVEEMLSNWQLWLSVFRPWH